MADDPQVRDYDKFMLRLPPGLRRQIAEAAAYNSRSMNAEIIDCLRQRFPDHSLEETLEMIQDLQNASFLSGPYLTTSEIALLINTLRNLEQSVRDTIETRAHMDMMERANSSTPTTTKPPKQRT